MITFKGRTISFEEFHKLVQTGIISINDFTLIMNQFGDEKYKDGHDDALYGVEL